MTTDQVLFGVGLCGSAPAAEDGDTMVLFGPAADS
jgi:hypothetical protein